MRPKDAPPKSAAGKHEIAGRPWRLEKRFEILAEDVVEESWEP